MTRRVRPNVVDSSAWLAYFADEPTAGDFAAAIEEVGRLDDGQRFTQRLLAERPATPASAPGSAPAS